MTNQDAMSPTDTGDREGVETPAALRLLATSLASQVELGIVIEQAHVSEVRAHRNTKMRLSHVEVKHDRLQRDFSSLLEREERVRAALVGDHVPTKAGDLLAEAREVSARSYNMEQSLMEARTLLEAAPGSTGNWEIARQQWTGRAEELLGTSTDPDEHAPEDVPRKRDLTEEASGEPTS